MSTAQNPRPPIGQLFVEQGHLTSEQLEGALAEQQRNGGRLGEILVERGYISRIHLAGALSKQWAWREDVPPPIESRATSMPPPEESVEPEPVVAAPEFLPLPALPASDPPPIDPISNGAPADVQTSSDLVSDFASQPPPTPSVEESGEPTASPARMEAFAPPVTHVSELEDQERLLRDLQARLRETHEQLAAGEARLGSLEAILGDLSQAYAALNARLDAQTREIEDLRRLVADQSARLATAASALLG
jgi:hypothetical protein